MPAPMSMAVAVADDKAARSWEQGDNTGEYQDHFYMIFHIQFLWLVG